MVWGVSGKESKDIKEGQGRAGKRKGKRILRKEAYQGRNGIKDIKEGKEGYQGKIPRKDTKEGRAGQGRAGRGKEEKVGKDIKEGRTPRKKWY